MRLKRAGEILKTIGMLLLAGGVAFTQPPSSAYRVLGQPDFRHNGLNMVQGIEIYQPGGIALDPRNGQTHLYIADTGNSRVLAWRDVNGYQIGDAPALVLGQPGPQHSAVLGIGAKGFFGLTGIAVDPLTGDLYAADTGNHRILRFAYPFANPRRVEPEAVVGQPDFTPRAAGATNSGLNQPRAVAMDSRGNLWIADTGNHRVLRYPAAALRSPTPPAADVVIGQRDFSSGSPNAGGQVSASGFDTPSGLALDTQDNLYVSDFNNARVLRFAPRAIAPGGNMAADAVWGQGDFSTRGVPQQASASSLAGPAGIAVANDDLYVSVPRDNRVLVFSLTAAGGGAKNIFGQTDPASTLANAGAAPLASPSSLAQPFDVKTDSAGNVYVTDSGNHRVLQFAGGAKSAIRVWGQSDFVSNSPNQIKPGSINLPYKIAIDYLSPPFALYVSDTGNHRILVWKDSTRFRSGDAADLVIGQPNLRTGAPNVDSQSFGRPSQTSLFEPAGIAIDPNNGSLYVADAGNHRVLRYPRPVDQAGRITPDAVIGQPNFTSADSALVSAGSLRRPTGLAIGPNGNLFVSDSGNNRVLEYPASAGNGALAIRVYGQPNMASSIKPSQVSAQTLSEPQGIAIDAASNLYVADTGANRVLMFPNTQNAPTAGMPATFVLGQPGYASANAGEFRLPGDVAVDSSGGIYVSDRGNNRVLVYPSLVFLPLSGASPIGAVGQQTPAGTRANWDSPDGLATAAGLRTPTGIYIDRQNTLYVADAGNSRVAHFLKAGVAVNAATLQASVPLARGALASLFAGELATDRASASTMPWPVELMNRQIVINDEFTAPLSFVGPGQVNFQAPSNAPLGAGRVAVRVADTGELIAGGSVVIAAAAPGLFTGNQSGSGQAIAVNADGTPNGPNNPAAGGTTITLYGTGQGQVSPAVPDGNPAPASPLAQTVAVPTASGTTCLSSQPSMCVAVGATGFGAVQYSGLAPGFVGLWQINVTIPRGTPAGNVPVRVVINGTPSNTVAVAVR